MKKVRIRWRDFWHVRRAMKRVQKKVPRLKMLMRHGVAKRVGRGVWKQYEAAMEEDTDATA